MLKRCIFILFVISLLSTAKAQDTAMNRELKQIVSNSHKILKSQASNNEKAEALFSIGAAYARAGLKDKSLDSFRKLLSEYSSETAACKKVLTFMKKPEALNKERVNRQRLESLLKLKISDVSFNKVSLKEALSILQQKCTGRNKENSISFILKDKLSAKDLILNLQFKDVSVEQLLKYLCLSSGLHYHLGQSFNVVLSKQQEMVTKYYSVPYWVREVIKDDSADKKQSGFSTFFNKFGMTSPVGSGLNYIGLRRLVVTNTEANHDILVKVLNLLKLYSTSDNTQIKIHAELIEIKNNNSLLLKSPGHITRELLMSLAGDERQTITQMEVVAVSGRTSTGRDFHNVDPVNGDHEIGHIFHVTSNLEPDGNTISSEFQWQYSDFSPGNKERQLSVETRLSISNGSSLVFQVQQADGVDKRNLYLVITQNLIGLDGQLIK
jgi:hypothetical protein